MKEQINSHITCSPTKKIIPHRGRYGEIYLRKKMLDKRVRQVDLARELGVSRQHVCMVLTGRVKSRRVMDYILARLGCKNGGRAKRPARRKVS